MDTFPGNIDLLTPGLKDKDSNIALTTIDVLGPQIPKFEQQLKQPFIDIARNNSFPIEARQNSIIHLSGVNAPEIKTLLVDNLENDDWQMRQAATLGLGLGNFKDPAIPTLFAPRVRDPQWQVRQATAISLGNLGQPKTIRYFKPLSNDSNLEVRRAGTLALATNLKKFPELRQPLMDKYRDSFEDKMVRFVAMKSLQNDGYELTEPSVDDLHKIGQDQAGEYDWVLRDAGLSMYEALSSTFGVPKLDRTFGISWSKSVKGAGIAYSGFNESLSVNRIRSTERMSNIFGTILGVVPIVNTFIRISSAKTSEERYSAVRGTPAWSIGAAVKVVNDIEIPKTIGQSARSVPNLNQFKSWSTYRTNSQFTARQFIPTPNIQAPSINSWNNRSFQSIPKIPSIPKFNYQPPPPVLFKMPPPINSFQRPQLYQRPIWQQPRFTPIQPYKPLPTAPPMMTAPTAPSFNFSAPRF
ncbi:MAG: HEAT repeat domain-containing protein [Actinomycetota bacterium]|nr:HEAT repeat domain-containing protein [Actinomycetota bacterium]